MTASRRPRTAPPRRPFSSRSFVGILLGTLVLRLPASTDACDEIPRYESMKAKGNPVPPVSPGFTADYECRPGYRLIVPLVRPTATVCQADGTWAPPLREACTKILCQPPEQILNGEFTNSHRDTFEYNEEVAYRCKPSGGPDEYSLVGESTLRCSGPNKWSSDPPECKVVKCEYPSVPDGNIVSGFGKKYYYKAEVEFACNQGYTLEGSRKIVCEANSTWVPEKPRCVKGVEPSPPTKPPVSSIPGHPPPDETPSKTLGVGVIVAIVVAVCAFLGLIVGCFVYHHKKRKGTYLTGESHKEVKFISL